MRKSKRGSLRTCLGIGIVGLIGLLVLGGVGVYFYFYGNLGQVAEQPRGSPNVVIQEPQNGLLIVAGDTFPFFANAYDPIGVVRLDLWINDTVVLSQASPGTDNLDSLSLTYPLTAVAPGTFTLVARAYNSQGEMGESLVHYVNVIAQTASSQHYAQYTVQEGDTLDSIALKSGVSVDAILQANPNLRNGNIKAGLVILIPLGANQPAQAAIPAPGGGAQPASSAGNPPGGQPGAGQQSGSGQPGNPPNNPLPGILPVFLPLGALGNFPSGIVPIHPSLFPLINSNNPPPNNSLSPPSGTQANLDDCQVTLSWTDDAKDETGYNIYRFDPGSPISTRVAYLKADATQYQESLPKSGRYGYEIEAIKTSGGIATRAASPPIWVEVPDSANCGGDSSPKRVFFQPISFQPNDSGLAYGFINVTINGFSAIRVPRGSQTRIPVGNWSDPANSWAIPLPELADMKAGDTLEVEIQGNATTDNKSPLIVLLGNAIASHTYESLILPNAKNQIWEAKADGMTVTYKIWLEDWQWGGQPNPNLSVPFPASLAEGQSTHTVSWDYTSLYPTDGFIVYSKYLCANLENPIGIQHVTPFQDSLVIQIAEEPLGCTCSYQVSAFSSLGESDRSPVTTEDCITMLPEETVQVIFESLKIDNLPDNPGVNITLSANGVSKTSNTFLAQAGVEQNLENIFFRGVRNRNRIAATFGAGQSRAIQVAFAISGICQGQYVFGGQRTNWTDAQGGGHYTVTSADGNCELKLTFDSRPPDNQTGGTSLALLPDGDACSDAGQCESGACEKGYCTPRDGTGLGGAFCNTNSQCASEVCNCTGFVQIPNSQALGVQQAAFACGPTSESGFCAFGKANGASCNNNSECASTNCNSGICAPVNGLGQPGEYCFSDSQCANNFCICPAGYDGDYCKDFQNLTESQWGSCADFPGYANGQLCSENDDCASRQCADGVCTPRDHTGLEGDYCHHNNHCFSGKCDCPNGADLLGMCIGYEALNFTAECLP
jgi:LysM repeat protein